MFTPIDPDVVTIMKTQGTIKFFVFEGWDFIASHEVFITIPHKIAYVEGRGINNHHRIFDCHLTLNKHSFIIEKVTRSSRNMIMPRLTSLSKPSEHMFLGMTIEAAESMAKLSKKERLVITSGLPTFSEIASEHNFTVRKPKFSDYFKATKTLQYKKRYLEK